MTVGARHILFRLASVWLAGSFCFAPAAAVDRSAAFAMNRRLGRGINLGNMFEAKPDDRAWGNPWHTDYARIIAETGFSHVRLPVRWEGEERSMATPPYNIEPGFFARIKQVVDTLLEHELLVIVNLHHHDALFDDPEGNRSRFLAHWRQIAEFFQNYPDCLLFEVLNEPHGNLTPDMWNGFFADALHTIRASNPQRMVLAGTPLWGGLDGVPYLRLPPDPNLIVTLHYYEPFAFTHQGAPWIEGAEVWRGGKWFDSAVERRAVENAFRDAFAYMERENVPLHIGEFGAFDQADMASRVRWTRFLARWFERQNLSWAYWEFSAGFGIYDPAAEQLRRELVDALLHDPMPPASAVPSEVVYRSDFATGVDSWRLNLAEDAEASMRVEAGALVVETTVPGEQAWHVQLVREGGSLAAERVYAVEFEAASSPGRTLVTRVGEPPVPWSNYVRRTLSPRARRYCHSFSMGWVEDPAATIVLDLGGGEPARFTLYQLELRQVAKPARP